ncbi:autotransporter outer membrane beta-barrel domain-containing protein [Escherichia coli]|nr:autotransporter outer membrane beta-barrel domain-containing protein [Escherichia coli]
MGNTGGFVDLGTYEYVLKSDGNSNWNLTNDVKPNRTPTQIRNRIKTRPKTGSETRPDSRSNADTPGETHHAFYSSRTQYGSNITVGL